MELQHYRRDDMNFNEVREDSQVFWALQHKESLEHDKEQITKALERLGLTEVVRLELQVMAIEKIDKVVTPWNGMSSDEDIPF
jgi:hypothetical protein